MRMRALSPKLRPTWWDGAVAALVAALAVLSAVWYYGGLESSGPLTATILHRGQAVQTVRLDRLTEEMTVTVEGDYHLTILLDRNGVRVAESDCPGRDCVHTGVITRGRTEYRVPAGAGGGAAVRRRQRPRRGAGIGGTP